MSMQTNCEFLDSFSQKHDQTTSVYVEKLANGKSSGETKPHFFEQKVQGPLYYQPKQCTTVDGRNPAPPGM